MTKVVLRAMPLAMLLFVFGVGCSLNDGGPTAPPGGTGDPEIHRVLVSVQGLDAADEALVEIATLNANGFEGFNGTTSDHALVVDLPEGQYRFNASAEGYVDSQVDMQITEAETVFLRLFREGVSGLFLSTNPREAIYQIWQDTAEDPIAEGNTPLDGPVPLDPGVYYVQVSASGYEPLGRDFMIEEDRVTNVHLDLADPPGAPASVSISAPDTVTVGDVFDVNCTADNYEVGWLVHDGNLYPIEAGSLTRSFTADAEGLMPFTAIAVGNTRVTQSKTVVVVADTGGPGEDCSEWETFSGFWFVINQAGSYTADLGSPFEIPAGQGDVYVNFKVTVAYSGAGYQNIAFFLTDVDSQWGNWFRLEGVGEEDCPTVTQNGASGSVVHELSTYVVESARGMNYKIVAVHGMDEWAPLPCDPDYEGFDPGDDHLISVTGFERQVCCPANGD